jgi:hypothetical protein
VVFFIAFVNRYSRRYLEFPCTVPELWIDTQRRILAMPTYPGLIRGTIELELPFGGGGITAGSEYHAQLADSERHPG